MYNNSRDPPSQILLLILTQLPSSFPLTNEYLFKKFNEYGDIKKILIFERGKTNKAFIEFYNIKNAIQARKEMNGYSVQGGKMIIHFSRLKNLNLEIVDNSRGTDYTQASSTSQNSDSILHSKTDDNIRVNLTNQISQSSSSRANSSPVRNEEINRLLDYDDDDFDIWKQEIPFDNIDMHPEISALLRQRQSRLLKINEIDTKVTAKMIYNVFTKFGNIEEILFEKQLKRAFIKYQTINQAIIAKEYLNNILFFDSMLRIQFEPLQSLQPTSLLDEYMIYYDVKFTQKIMPLSNSLLITGIQDSVEISDLIKMFAKIKDLKINVNNSLQLTLNSIADTLKIIAVFSDYEYKAQKLNIMFQ